jgi:hypothetical protein
MHSHSNQPDPPGNLDTPGTPEPPAGDPTPLPQPPEGDPPPRDPTRPQELPGQPSRPVETPPDSPNRGTSNR